MDKREEFDKDFDFEKEYGIDPNMLLDTEYENDEELAKEFDASFDEDFIADFDAKFGTDFDAKFAEEFGEGGAEGLVDAGELFGELLRHVAGEFRDEVEEFFAGPFHIADLVGEELIPLGDFLVFFDRGNIDTAECLDGML